MNVRIFDRIPGLPFDVQDVQPRPEGPIVGVSPDIRQAPGLQVVEELSKGLSVEFLLSLPLGPGKERLDFLAVQGYGISGVTEVVLVGREKTLRTPGRLAGWGSWPEAMAAGVSL